VNDRSIAASLHDADFALSTGASAGIGAATAKLFASADCNLVLVARRADKLEETKKACEAAGKSIQVEVHTVDASKVSDLSAFVDKLKGRKIDILSASTPTGHRADRAVNNAGGVRGTEAVGDIDPDDVDIMFSLNVTGLIHLTQLVVKHFFKPQDSGHVINLGSVAGREAYQNGSICATPSCRAD